jgi:hypothetical protein
VIQEGQLRYFCVTLRPEPAGADGGGVIAEVIFEPADGGVTEVTISRAEITDPSGENLQVAPGPAVTLRVQKDPGIALYWLIAIGVAGGVVLLALFEGVRRLRRRRTARGMA